MVDRKTIYPMVDIYQMATYLNRYLTEVEWEGIKQLLNANKDLWQAVDKAIEEIVYSINVGEPL